MKRKKYKYMVQTIFVNRWDDAEWTENDKPLRFDTKLEAYEAIRDHVQTLKSAGMQGSIRDFRVVPDKS